MEGEKRDVGGQRKGTRVAFSIFDYHEIFFEVGFFSAIAMFSFHVTWYSGFSGL